MAAHPHPELGELTQEQCASYAREGYLVVPGWLSADEVGFLRRQSDAAVAAAHQKMVNKGEHRDGLSRINERYYVAGTSRFEPDLKAFLTSPRIANLCRAVVGPEAFVFTEVFVCKEAGQIQNACWHQDYSYLDFFYPGLFKPNLSVWFALDDMTEENGALQVMAYSDGGPNVPVPHHMELDWDSDEVVDFGNVPKRTLPMPAGTMVLMSGLLAHWSGPNQSNARRRAYLVQYSPAPIIKDGKPLQLDYPVVQSGR